MKETKLPRSLEDLVDLSKVEQKPLPAVKTRVYLDRKGNILIETKKLPKLTGDLLKRFKTYFKEGKADECWNWNGHKDPRGYGSFYIGKKPYLAHRMSYMVHIGKVKDGMCVLHECDNPSCVNPSHLFIGTIAFNCIDRALKGRSASGDRHWTKLHPEILKNMKRSPRLNSPKGEDHPMRVLSLDDVAAIRSMYVPRKVSQESLGKMFGVSRGAIQAVVSFKNWK